jgi:hypothetical protein
MKSRGQNTDSKLASIIRRKTGKQVFVVPPASPLLALNAHSPTPDC